MADCRDPPPSEWTPVVGSRSQEVSDGRTSTLGDEVDWGRLIWKFLRESAVPRIGIRLSGARVTRQYIDRLPPDRLLFSGFAQHVPTAPHGLQVILAVRGVGELLPQFADEHLNDLLFGFVDAAIKVVEKHCLGQCRAFAKAQ